MAECIPCSGGCQTKYARPAMLRKRKSKPTLRVPGKRWSATRRPWSHKTDKTTIQHPPTTHGVGTFASNAGSATVIKNATCQTTRSAL